MKFELEDYKKFIELVNDVKVSEIIEIKKDVISYRIANHSKRITKENLHSLVVKALSLLSKKYKVYIKIENGICLIKINKFKMDAPIKEWTNTIIFISLLKLK